MHPHPHSQACLCGAKMMNGQFLKIPDCGLSQPPRNGVVPAVSLLWRIMEEKAKVHVLLLKSINKMMFSSSPLIFPWGSSECSEEKNSQYSSPRCRSGLVGWFNHTFCRKFLGLLFLALQLHMGFLLDWRSHRVHQRLEGGEESSISSSFPHLVRLLWDTWVFLTFVTTVSTRKQACLPPVVSHSAHLLGNVETLRQCKFLCPAVSGFFHVSFLRKETRISLSARQS